MPKTITGDWTRWSVGDLADEPYFNRACCPFETVTHTTHLNSAVEIIQTGIIRPGLVYDESILNTERITVVWLSPNRWSPGYRYGNIQWEFPWASILEGHQAYWVETVMYEINACRILITDKNYDGHPQLLAYDPTQKTGPWWFNKETGKHYYNNYYCMEFMLEASLEVITSLTSDFVLHHPTWCNSNRKNPKSCRHLGWTGYKAGAELLARLLANSEFNDHIKLTRIDGDYRKGTDALMNAHWYLSKELTKFSEECRAIIDMQDSVADALVIAALRAFSEGQRNDARELIRLFESKDAVRIWVQRKLEDAVGLPEGGLDEEDW